MNPSLLPSLAWFAHIAYHRSFTKAAMEMGVSSAGLSRNLKSLEHHLGVKLLYRTTRDVSLTEAGHKLYAMLMPTLGAIDEALRSLGDTAGEPSGLIRINTSRMAAKVLIEPHLVEFYTSYPNLQLELVMTDLHSHIIADTCNASIRLGCSNTEQISAVPITPMLSMVIVGSADYFKRNDVPRAPKDLLGHNCITYRTLGGDTPRDWDFYDPGQFGEHFTQSVKGNFTTNDDEGMTRAAMKGLGIIQTLDISIQDQLADGRLIRVLSDWERANFGFYLYTLSQEPIPAKVQALLDFLIVKRDSMTLQRP